MITPFANDSESMQIGELIIENQQDKITIYGDIDIHRDTKGLEHAKQLQELMTHIVTALTANESDMMVADQISAKSSQRSSSQAQAGDDVDVIDNPFL